jgi:uncharacterized protein (TIGR02145 family)
MKHLYFFICLISLVITNDLQAQNDSIYFWKSGVLQEKRSIKPVDLDSITFKRPIINLSDVTICSQVWSGKNLDVTTYSDGTPIPQVTDPIAWQNLTTGAWCYYNNDPSNNAVYGKLYNWYAAVGIYDDASLTNPTLRKHLAPEGWHIPTDAELTTLITCLGGEPVAGGPMKEAGISHWATPNTGATNSSGFKALPGGFRYYNGTFYSIGTNSYWWSTLAYSPTYSWHRELYYNSVYVSRNYSDNTDGFSIRCIRN